MEYKENKKDALKWIDGNKPCVYRYGWAYRGAASRKISKEEAKKLLPGYYFGNGAYALSFIKEKGEDVLEFNELSENDML